jgi:hypothetical protein
MLLAALMIFAGSASCSQKDKVYFATDLKGTVCGYSEIELSTIEKDGRELQLLEQTAITRIHALGTEITSEVILIYHIDPLTGKFTYHESEIHQGQMDLWSKIYIEGNKARFTSSTFDETVIELPPDVVLENTLFHPHLIEDFHVKGLEEKTYEIFEVREAAVQKSTVKRIGTEEIELAGSAYNALVLDVFKQATGVKYRIWIDTETGYTLRVELPNDRLSYRTDSSVKNRIETGDADKVILYSVDVSITDFQSISYMKVKAEIEPFGLRVSEETLNVPGQSFSGSVEGNLIDGIFEIEHKKYDGTGAPPFPTGYGDDETLEKYLKPQTFIQPDDTVLIKKAREITEGSEDSWEAAVRLSDWVAKNIGYAIPGGGSARKTYDIRAGECGAHSFLLASFCRAVGIPCRVVWGCMYFSQQSGSFGQHAWNEIYMGDAGWIPVDCTAMETDFVDSGHIRIGEYQSMTTSFNPKEMEILEHRTGFGDTAREGAAEEKYGPYLGLYHNPRQDVEVLVQEGTLNLDIKGRMTLPFTDPDDDGRWYCKLSNSLYITFEEDEEGKIPGMAIIEIVRMLRQPGEDTIDEKIPEEMRKYIGKYLFAQRQAEFTVFYENGSLAIYDPLEKSSVGLKPPGENGGWLDEHGKNTTYFDVGDEGGVTSMNIHAKTRFERN